MLKTYHGSCHCGAVRFECDLDLTAGTRRCNCSFCAKTRMWKAFAIGDTFRLLSAQDQLADYRGADSNWPEGNVHHYFCRRCGVRCFSRGYLEMAPFDGWFHAVNVATLDDATDAELAAAPIQYEDGRNNRWDHEPDETRYL
jgi:hypothetical protein